jgi:hypothetical protein
VGRCEPSQAQAENQDELPKGVHDSGSREDAESNV